MSRLLIAEDEPVSRLRLKRMLEGWGYDVIAVEDGEAAWRVLSEDDAPGLAILDWQMPELDGIEVCRKLRQRDHAPYVYTLLLTAHHDTDRLVKAMDAGADDFLSKPFEPHELKARLRAGCRILRLQSDLIAARESLRELATRDSLTSIWNRRAILELLERELARSARAEGAGLGVLIADLDHFKRVNDSHGHLAGDDVLREVSVRLAREVRQYDSLGRLGGEEFLILLADCDRHQAETVAERIRRLIADEPILTTAGEISITLSLGAAWVSHGRQVNSRDVLETADRSLYEAKAGGRNLLRFEEQTREGHESPGSSLLFFNDPTHRRRYALESLESPPVTAAQSPRRS